MYASGPSAGLANFLRAFGILLKLKKTKRLARMLERNRHLVYEFDGWELDLARHELRARGVPVPLGSRAFQIPPA